LPKNNFIEYFGSNMTLIQSVSGIRGTIGGASGNNLTPADAVRFASSYGHWLQKRHPKPKISVVIGRDARPSGPMISSLVAQTLVGMGIHVIDLGLSTTPTVEMAVPYYSAQGGIILTASHNPVEWNALKLLNEKGEFLSAEDGQALLSINPSDIIYASVQAMGSIECPGNFIDKHIEAILKHPLVDVAAIRKARFRVSVNGVHSSGGIAIPQLLEQLGVMYIHNPYGEPTGKFPHNPEPLPEHLTTYCSMVKEESVDVGIVVDPDVDRLALVDENGRFFGEENTLIAVADYVLSRNPGPVVSNLSSSRGLADIAAKHGCQRYTSAVGEVHVVAKMKEVGAVLGGEGNGGVILPDLHYGRDALAGVALLLSYMARQQVRLSDLKAIYPEYVMVKSKVEAPAQLDTAKALADLRAALAQENPVTIDGLWFERPEGWIHIRRSNTEPIFRIYTEALSVQTAEAYANQAHAWLKSIIS
jgi:phosphomannomutase